jgi:hypothetical protein
MDETRAHLRHMGKKGFEGFVLWAGTRTGTAFDVTSTIVPAQVAYKSEKGICVVVESDELHRLNVSLYQSGLTLIGQVHSHPGIAYHSEMDDAYPIATTAGSFSIVVPHFAVRPFTFPTSAVFRLSAGGEWIEVPLRQVNAIFSVKE